MCFSFSRWCLSAILFIGCSSGPSSDWPIATGTSDAAFTIEMPVQNGEQTGELEIAGEKVRMNIAISADSGITYVASHFQVPKQLMTLEAGERADLIWKIFVDRANAVQAEGSIPVVSAVPSRSGWFVNADDVQMGIAMYLHEDHAIVLNAGTPGMAFGPDQRRRMERYFNSIRFQD